MRIAWWVRRGYWHGVRRGRGIGRIKNLILSAGWWVASPVVIIAEVLLVTWPLGRYYLSPERDAVLAIFATRSTWSVVDHVTKAPGTGRGRALRAVLLPALLPLADAQNLAVSATATSSKVADLYRADLPDLDDNGRNIFGGTRLGRRSAS
ncbi:hypothetical protein ACMT9Y_15385 [Clavibacter tessellarius]|uniref:hypothetical protein n=1 Tax=Clavibacter tessellarius TaxID=31965 RepID=UPI0039E8C66B